LIVIDAFTKEITVFLLKNKTPDVILPALEQAFTNLGGTPEIFYTDDEGAYNSSILKLYFEKNNIKHIITRKHAPMAERAIKTIKDMLYKRMKHETTTPWYELVHEILFVLNYMRKHRSHGMTPKEARDPKNLTKVKNNLENNRIKNRKYPEVKVGDKVRIYKKRKNFQKSNVSIWSENRYEVKKIEDVPNAGKLYHVIGMPKPLLSAEILL
jgi:transposase InsO family protein